MKTCEPAELRLAADGGKLRFLRITGGSTDYNPRMAGAPSPERPVVLRRLGVIKDPQDPFLQESRAQRETPQDALELFATEAESAPRLERWLAAIRPHVVSAIGFVRRNPATAVMAASAISVVVGIWAISRLVDASPVQRAAPVPPPAESSAAPAAPASVPTEVAASTRVNSTTRSAAPVNAVRTGTTGVIARGQQAARNPAAGPTAAIARPVLPTPRQPDPAVASAPVATPAPAAAAPPAADATAAVIDDTIYSAEDRDVIPPQTEEKLPGPTIAAWTTRTNAMEIIVSQTGAVERVRLVTPPQRMPDMFALSRAKVWMFKPAMKDGRPVRYRLLLTWEVNP